jgi:hypothetical protein
VDECEVSNSLSKAHVPYRYSSSASVFHILSFTASRLPRWTDLPEDGIIGEYQQTRPMFPPGMPSRLDNPVLGPRVVDLGSDLCAPDGPKGDAKNDSIAIRTHQHSNISPHRSALRHSINGQARDSLAPDPFPIYDPPPSFRRGQS